MFVRGTRRGKIKSGAWDGNVIKDVQYFSGICAPTSSDLFWPPVSDP